MVGDTDAMRVRHAAQPAPAGDAREFRRGGDALAEVERSIDAAWEAERLAHPDEDDETTANRVLADPSAHPWRLVDAALARLSCPDCGSELGAGRGCASCDLADGFRFAAREPDRPDVPPGHEHAIRVSTAVLRAPDRYPAWAVEANRIYLPLFLAGEMPTRRAQEAMLEAAREGVRVDTAGVATFAELAARAAAARRRGS